MARGNYNTRQRECIWAALEAAGDRHVTAEQVAALVRAQGEDVGKTTIYRFLENLTARGEARKCVGAPGAPACYQLLRPDGGCRAHYHLQCARCGRLFHVDCARMDQVAGHIEAEHGFALDSARTLLMGVCAGCQGEGGARDGADDAEPFEPGL